MFEVRNIIYFDLFYFKNGNAAKSKFFLILKNNKDQFVIASLPTSKNKIPSSEISNFGCIEYPELDFNCFTISKLTEVTENGKYFDLNTYVYGHEIDDYDINHLKQVYRQEGIDYIIWGKMKEDLYNDIIFCFKNSKSVKRKYKRVL